jgi:hypothetical protein
MASNDVIFVKKQGGLGRPLSGEDFISGLLFYSDATLPSGFLSTDRVKSIFSIQDAEALGILNTGLGATQSTSTHTVTNKGTAGETVTLSVQSTKGLITLCSYTLTTADVVSITSAALAISTAINALTSVHGFVSSPAVGVITITAPKKEGVYLNSGTPYTYTVTGTTTTYAATLVQNVVVGVASDIDILYYHVNEFFRIQPKGQLFVGIYPVSDATTFASITLMQNVALGKLRQVGVYQKTTTFATTQVTTLQSVINANVVNHKPLEVIYQGLMTSATSLNTLADLRALNAANVSVVLGQDGANNGYRLWLASNVSIGCLGTTLGAVALANVNEDIAWTGKFNVSNVEFDTLAFANGAVYSAQSDGLIDNLNSLGYIILKKFVSYEGSYFNDSHTCVAVSNDFAYIENNRTFNKAIRNLRVFLLPQLASPIKLNSNGTLTEDVIGFYETLCAQALDVMQRNAEVSAYKITIDPTQNVLSTSKLVISVAIVPLGVARTIQVNVGFTLSI